MAASLGLHLFNSRHGPPNPLDLFLLGLYLNASTLTEVGGRPIFLEISLGLELWGKVTNLKEILLSWVHK